MSLPIEARPSSTISPVAPTTNDIGMTSQPEVGPREEYLQSIFDNLPFGEDGTELPPTDTETRITAIINTMSQINIAQRDGRIPKLKTKPFALFTVEHRDNQGHLAYTSRVALLTVSYNKLPGRKLYLVAAQATPTTPAGFYDIDLSITDQANRAFEQQLAAARKRALNPEEVRFLNRTFKRIWKVSPPQENKPVTGDITAVDKPFAARKVTDCKHIRGALQKVLFPREPEKRIAA